MTKFSGKQQYMLYHQDIDDIGCVIEIDFDHPNIMTDMREYYEFYHDEVPEAGGMKLVSLFLQHLAGAVFHVSASGTLNTEGVRSSIAQWEGYPALDGSQGYRLMQHDHQEVSDDEFQIEEVSGYKYFEAE